MNDEAARLRRDRIALVGALLGLSLVYAVWFHDDRHLVAALLVFALPPALLALGVLANRAAARFWAGVFALGWFSHGVMMAWSDPSHRSHALIAVALSLVAIFVANAAGLRARFGRR